MVHASNIDNPGMEACFVTDGAVVSPNSGELEDSHAIDGIVVFPHTESHPASVIGLIVLAQEHGCVLFVEDEVLVGEEIVSHIVNIGSGAVVMASGETEPVEQEQLMVGVVFGMPLVKVVPALELGKEDDAVVRGEDVGETDVGNGGDDVQGCSPIRDVSVFEFHQTGGGIVVQSPDSVDQSDCIVRAADCQMGQIGCLGDFVVKEVAGGVLHGLGGEVPHKTLCKEIVAVEVIIGFLEPAAEITFPLEKLHVGDVYVMLCVVDGVEVGGEIGFNSGIEVQNNEGVQSHACGRFFVLRMDNPVVIVAADNTELLFEVFVVPPCDLNNGQNEVVALCDDGCRHKE